jgi:hypothetical protein
VVRNVHKHFQPSYRLDRAPLSSPADNPTTSDEST